MSNTSTSQFTTDTDGYRTADHPIFTCRNCGYSTADVYTAGVINDQTGECPKCELDADIGGIWCTDNCDWY